MDRNEGEGGRMTVHFSAATFLGGGRGQQSDELDEI